MGVKIGDVDIASEIIDLKYQLFRTQMIIDNLIEEDPKLQKKISKVIDDINKSALEKVKKAYPNMGIIIK